MATKHVSTTENKEKSVQSRKSRRSNLCLNKPKHKQAKIRKILSAEEEIGVSASPTERRSTSGSNTTFTPTDQCLQVFHEHILNAPQKSKPKKHNASRKRLFTNSTLENMTEKVTHLLPGFLQKLHSANLCYDFCNFINLVCDNNFPLTNIALLLFLDVVRWYSLPKTSMMTYREDTMKFWRVVYRLFHGTVLRFLSGVKSTGDSIGQCSKGGNITPDTTSINFAVPDQGTINDYYPNEFGLFYVAVNSKFEENTSIIVVHQFNMGQSAKISGVIYCQSNGIKNAVF